jgi:acyl carrier protein
MLAPDMDMEADLGIDTVKQATVLATLAERLNLTDMSELHLSEYQTLEHIIAMCEGTMGASSPCEEAPIAVPPANRSAPSSKETTATVLEVIAKITGYAADILEPDMELEADLGIDTVKQATIWAELAERFGVTHDETVKLSAIGTIRQLDDFFASRSKADAPQSPQTVAAPIAATISPRIAQPKKSVPVVPLRAARIESKDNPVEALYALIEAHTPYPCEMLEADLALKSDLALDDETLRKLERAVADRFNLSPAWSLPKDARLGDLLESVQRATKSKSPEITEDQWLGRQVLRLCPAPSESAARFKIAGKRVWILGDDASSVSKLKSRLSEAGSSIAEIIMPEDGVVETVIRTLDRLAHVGAPDILIDLTAGPASISIFQESPTAVSAAVDRAMD